MRITTLNVGMLETNGFVLAEQGDAVIIDPGDEPERFIEVVEAQGLAVRAILLTHGHGDHIGAVAPLRERFKEAEVCIHRLDAPMLTDPNLNLAAQMGIPLDVGPADRFVEDSQLLHFGGIKLETRHVPGHTPGQVVYLHGGHLFAGDTIFAGSVGRFDLPGGDGELMISSIIEKLLSLPDETVVHPGHGPETTIGRERRSNPFLAGKGWF